MTELDPRDIYRAFARCAERTKNGKDVKRDEQGRVRCLTSIDAYVIWDELDGYWRLHLFPGNDEVVITTLHNVYKWVNEPTKLQIMKLRLFL